MRPPDSAKNFGSFIVVVFLSMMQCRQKFVGCLHLLRRLTGVVFELNQSSMNIFKRPQAFPQFTRSILATRQIRAAGATSDRPAMSAFRASYERDSGRQRL